MCEYDLTQLGSGSYGNVYKAQHIMSKEFFALKLVKSSFCESLNGITPNEYDILFRIEHPNIAKALDIITRDQITPCLPRNNFRVGVIMPLADGDAVRLPKTLDPIYASWQIASGVEALHASGYYHLDIKPANCLLFGNVLKLADFGLAIHMSTPNTTVLTVTVSHRPPEVKGDLYQLTDKIDVFSLGVLINDFTINARPIHYKKESDDEYIFKNINAINQRAQKLKDSLKGLEYSSGILNGYYPVYGITTTNVCSLIQKMISVDPNDRGTAKEAREYLGSLLSINLSYHAPKYLVNRNRHFSLVPIYYLTILKNIILSFISSGYDYPARMIFTTYHLFAQLYNPSNGKDNNLIVFVVCLTIALKTHLDSIDEYQVFDYLYSAGHISEEEMKYMKDSICDEFGRIETSSIIGMHFNEPNLYDTLGSYNEIKSYFDNFSLINDAYKKNTSGFFYRTYNNTYLISTLLYTPPISEKEPGDIVYQ